MNPSLRGLDAARSRS